MPLENTLVHHINFIDYPAMRDSSQIIDSTPQAGEQTKERTGMSRLSVPAILFAATLIAPSISLAQSSQSSGGGQMLTQSAPELNIASTSPSTADDASFGDLTDTIAMAGSPFTDTPGFPAMPDFNRP